MKRLTSWLALNESTELFFCGAFCSKAGCRLAPLISQVKVFSGEVSFRSYKCI